MRFSIAVAVAVLAATVWAIAGADTSLHFVDVGGPFAAYASAYLPVVGN